jgi:hypothetical protein
VNVTGSHVAGGTTGAIVAVILAALDKKIGLNLTDAEAASFALALASVGAALGHAVGKAWNGVGLLPALRRGFLGAKSSAK